MIIISLDEYHYVEMGKMTTNAAQIQVIHKRRKTLDNIQ